jgi:pimeloyl-ACP methyl ester carboxylesterase
MPSCERAGRSIYYDVAGDPARPPLLLVMGLALSSQAWYRLPARLAPRFRVIRFDNRGTGRSLPAARVPYRMATLADDAAAVLAACGVRGRDQGGAGAYVFGISMGGMIAQELTLRHPGLVRALALGCTFACFRRSRRPRLDIAVELMLASLQPWRGLAPVLGILFSREYRGANAAELRRWMRLTDRCGVANVVAQLGAIVRHSTMERLGTIAVPTLVMSGDADRLVPVENAHALAARIAGARLRLFPGAGHVFPLEREDETVQTLQAFFDEVGAEAAA